MSARQNRKTVRKNYFKNSRAAVHERRRRRAANAVKFLSGAAVVAAMSFLFVFGYDLLTQSGYFRAAQLNVSGLEHLSAREVLQQARLSEGDNIFSVNLTMTRKRLLAHPWIADAEVRRDIPAGIDIRIREHRPLAIIDLNRKFLLSTRGEIFKEWKESDPLDLPVVSGLEFSDLNVGGSPPSQAFEAVMSVLNQGRETGSVVPTRQIRQIEIDRDIGLTIHVGDRVGTIRLGYDDYPDKFRRLQEVLWYFKNGYPVEKVNSIDLNDPDRIVVNIDGKASNPAGHKEV